jgi:hypothetical protein
VRECDEAGVSALHVAARLGRVALVPALVAAGVPVDTRDFAGQVRAGGETGPAWLCVG